jgi:peroxiredoxin
MKKFSILFSILMLLLFTNVLLAQKAKVNESAPDFKLTDSDGKEYVLSNFKGKYVVLEWANFGCPFVKKHYNSENMQKLQKIYGEKDVVWFTICSSGEGKQGYLEGDELKEKLKKEKINSMAYLIDAEGRVGKAYGARTTPHMFVIDPKGKLIYAGGIDDKVSTDVDDVKGATNYVSAALDAAMAGKDVKVQSASPYGCGVKYAD